MGSYVEIDSGTASSSSSIELTGIDTTYNVYMATWKDVAPANDNTGMYIRVTTGGTPDSDSEYDQAVYNLLSYAAFEIGYGAGSAYWNMGNIGTGSSETQQGVAYLFNFGDASEYSFLTLEKTNMMADPNNLYGQHGALVHTVAEANDGLSFYIASGNIASGEFRLYGLKK